MARCYISTTTTERGAVILNTGKRRFTTEHTRTDCSRAEKWIMPDGQQIDFLNGPLVFGPTRWIEIDEAGAAMGYVTQADIMRAR